MTVRIVAIIGLVIFSITCGITNWAYGQNFRAKVSIQATQLQPEYRNILNELPRLLDDYINHYTWAVEYPDIQIESNISIVIETATPRGSEVVYRAQFIINSPGGENFLDKGFEFPYQTGQLMEHQRALFDPLLSMIDFYVYMVIAGELDTYVLLGGTPYYGRAAAILDEGLVSNYSLGWRNRQEQLQLITNDNHRPLREAKFYYYEGLFYIEERADSLITMRAPKYSAKVVELLEDVFHKRPNSVVLKRFLDAHYLEFCKLFTYDPDRKNILAMMRIDNRHSDTYEGCKSEGGGVQRF